MKKYFAFALMSLLLWSCLNDDDYKPEVTVRGVVVLNSEQPLGFQIELDDWQCVVPQSTDVEDYEPTDKDRVLVQLSYPSSEELYKDTAEAKILDLGVYQINDLIRYKDTVAVDTLGSDPVGTYNGYVYQTDKYLNIAYAYQYGSQEHSFNLVYYPDSIGDNGEVFLKFQHNANEDSKEYTFWEAYRVFDMSSIAPFANVQDSIAYVIHVNPGTFTDAVALFEGYYYHPDVLRAKRQ